MSTIIGVDKIINQSMYAKGSVDAYKNINDTVPIRKFTNGGLIGNVYSYVVRNDGKFFWMFIDSRNWPSGTYFVEHDPNKLNVINLNNILADIKREADKQKQTDKGLLQYNIDKYLPWIIGGGIAVIALPSLLGNQHKLAGMKKNNGALLIGAAALAIYLFSKKKYKAGTPVIETIDEGFVNDYNSESATTPAKVVTVEDYFGNKAFVPTNEPTQNNIVQSGSGASGGGGGYIDYVGPFKVDYNAPQNMVSGYRKKGNLGAIKTC